MVSIPEHGQLVDLPTPRLLLDLYRAQFSGRLELRRDRVEKGFLFQSGIPIFAESNLAREQLGAQLIDSGELSQEDYSRVSARVTRDHCKEGAALLELELIEPRRLFIALKEQVRARIVECFGWVDGEFSIDPSANVPDDAQPFRADVYALIREGVESHWSVDRVLRDLEPNMALFPAPTPRLARLRPRLFCDAAADNFIDALNGQTTLWKALRLATTPRALATAWVLDIAQALHYREQPLDANSRPVEVELVLAKEDAPSENGVRIDDPSSSSSPAQTQPHVSIDLRAKIEDMFERLDALDYYELLDVNSDASSTEIRDAYLLAAKTFHPDALAKADLDEETLTRANRVFALTGKAYGVLNDPALRGEYDTAQGSDEEAIDVDRLANAETLYRKGEILLRQGNFTGALEFLAPAVEFCPDEFEYQSALGWALYKGRPSDPIAARRHLECAAELAPDDAVSIFRLSVVVRNLGDAETASTLLNRAQQLDPKIR